MTIGAGSTDSEHGNSAEPDQRHRHRARPQVRSVLQELRCATLLVYCCLCRPLSKKLLFWDLLGLVPSEALGQDAVEVALKASQVCRLTRLQPCRCLLTQLLRTDTRAGA